MSELDGHGLRRLRTPYSTTQKLAVAGCAIGMSLTAQISSAETPSEHIVAERRAVAARLLMPDHADVAQAERRGCYQGIQPKKVAKERAGGWPYSPDAADTCITALTRMGRDGRLSEVYLWLVTALNGDVTTAPTLPRAIGGAALNNQAIVPIGNGKAAKVTPAIAFDAGFTVAYESRAAVGDKSDPKALREVTEACLDEQKDAATCFSVGWTHGAMARQSDG